MEAQEQKPPGTSSRIGNLSHNWETAGGSKWKLRILRGPSHKRPLYFFKFCLQELYQFITVKTGEKSPHTSGKGKKKGTILKCAGTFYSWKGLSSRETFTRASTIGVLLKPYSPGDRKHPTPSLSRLPALSRGESKTKQSREALVNIIPEGHRVTKRLRPNHRTIETEKKLKYMFP